MMDETCLDEANARRRNEERIDVLCDRFEEAWRDGGRPCLADFAGEAAAPVLRNGKAMLLHQLIAIDLWYRWRASNRGETSSPEIQGATPREDARQGGDSLPDCPLLDDYVRCLPELGSLEELPDDLIAREYEVRCSRGIAPSHDDYAGRFGSRESLIELLREADAQQRLRPRKGSDAAKSAWVPDFVSNPDQDGNATEFGDYVILKEIGRGGMGVVFQARQRKTQRIEALKLILAGRLASQREVDRLYGEARAVARLDHPQIVPLFDVGEHQGQHFLSMGFVDGPTLHQRLVDNGPLPAHEAAALVEKIARAVEYAHQCGVIHRDLKPANILLDQHGNPRVSDFGLAKQLDVDSGLTDVKDLVGTLRYMPPEQASGKSDQVGPRSDVYSLGAVLYETLTGRPPFRGATDHETQDAVLNQPPVAPRALNGAIPRDLDTICLKCLRKDAGQRYQSAAELAEDLRRFLNGEPIQARPVSSAEAVWSWCRRKPVAAALMAMSVIAVLAIATGVFFRQQMLHGQQLLDLSAVQIALANDLTAERQAKADLHEYFALVNRARETLALKRPGWTASALDDLQKAARLRPGDEEAAELRSLVARCWTGFDLQLDQPLTVAEGFEVGALAFSPDGRYLAVAQEKSDWAPAVFVYEVETRAKAFEFGFIGLAVGWSNWLQGGKFQDGIHSLAFSPDGKQLAAGSRFGKVRCWRLGSTDRPRVFAAFGDRESVEQLAFSPDGRWLFAANATVKAIPLDAEGEAAEPIVVGEADQGWYGAGSKWLVTYEAGVPQVRSITAPQTRLPIELPRGSRAAFGPDGDRLAIIAPRDNDRPRGMILDASTGLRARMLADPHDSQPWLAGSHPRLFFSPDGGMIYGHDREGPLLVWDAASGRLVLTALLDEFRLGRYAVDPLGRYLAFGGVQRAALIPVRKRPLLREAAWQASPIRAIDLSSDGRRLWCGTDSVLSPDRPLTKRFLFSRHDLSGTAPAEKTAVLLPFPGGGRFGEANADLATAPSHDGLAALGVPLAGVYTWDVEAGRVAAAIASGGTESTCRFLEEDRLEIRGGQERCGAVEDAAAANGRALRIQAGPERCEVRAVWPQPDPPAAPGDWAYFAVAKLRGGAPCAELIETGSGGPDAVSRFAIPEAMIPRDAYHLFALGCGPGGDRDETHFLAALATEDEEVEVWVDRVIAVPIGDFARYKWVNAFRPLSFHRDGERLSGVVFSRRLYHWQVPGLELDWSWDNTQVAESSGAGYWPIMDAGRELALAGSLDGIVTELSRGKIQRRWPAQSAALTAVRLNSDESWAVVGNQQGGCRIARVPGGEPVGELPGHYGAVRAIALSPDDQWLATGDEEGTLRLWQRAGETFSLWLALPFPGPVQAVRMTPDRAELIVLVQGETAVRVLAWGELEERLRELGLEGLRELGNAVAIHSKQGRRP
jgi:WD40 repeat protein/tRNA A-37 threonylcarbamoyl transferase component Bud32